MHLSAEQVAQYERDGFLIFRELFSGAECDALAEEVERVLAEVRAEKTAAGLQPDEIFPSGVFVGLAVRSSVFRRLAADPRLVDPLEDLWGPDVGFLSDKVVFKSADVDFGSPWHQDWSYWQGANKISIWIALDEATEENGCLLVLPGTHHSPIDHDHVVEKTGFGNRLDPRTMGIEAEPLAVPLPRGSALLFHDLTLHASLPNRSGRVRRALISTYRSLGVEDLDYPSLPAAHRVRGAEPAPSP